LNLLSTIGVFLPGESKRLLQASGNSIEVSRNLTRGNKFQSLVNTGYRSDPGAPLHKLLLREGANAATQEEVQQKIIEGVYKGLDQPDPIRVGIGFNFMLKQA
jgi:hypothetical protein